MKIFNKAEAALQYFKWREKQEGGAISANTFRFPKNITEFANRSLSKQIFGIFQICYTSRHKKNNHSVPDCEHLNKLW